MRLVSRIFVLTLLLCCFAFAQTTGNIYGTVTSSGAPLPKVTVTLTSPALINEQAQVTDPSGLFQFPTLPIGIYKVTFRGGWICRLRARGIDIQAGFSADVNMAMVKGDASQTIVSSQTQMVDQRGTNLQNVVSDQAVGQHGGLARYLVDHGCDPRFDDCWHRGRRREPGRFAAYVRITAMATPATISNTCRRWGDQQARNQLDGVNTTEGTSSTGMYYDYGAVGELRMATASNDASMPQPGQFLNAVVKQGGDTTHGGAYVDYENPSFQGHNITPAQQEEGAGMGTRITRYQDYDGDIGGHIKKDKLWYFFGLRDERLGNTVTGFPAENPTEAQPADFTRSCRTSPRSSPGS